MKLAITTDWLTTVAGAERVILQMHELFPQAPIFTTVYKHGTLPGCESLIRTSPAQKWYTLMRNHRLLLGMMPRAAESWDLRGYDVILSSSHAVGKGLIPPSTSKHICYCHTPVRYAWEMEDEYLDDFGIGWPLRTFIKKRLENFRRWDLTTAKRVDLFIANSTTTQERIKRTYGRDSVVLPPPVNQRFFDHQSIGERGNHYLALGRLVPYKRFDLLIQVANAQKLPLVIAGTGPDEARLKRMAGPTVEFKGYVADDDLPALYASAKAFLFPVKEDAGIVPLEAQACGTPVIALGKGGALDTVKGGETGVFFSEQNAESLKDALGNFESMHFDSEKIRAHAKGFSSARFRERLNELVTTTLAHSSQSSAPQHHLPAQ